MCLAAFASVSGALGARLPPTILGELNQTTADGWLLTHASWATPDHCGTLAKHTHAIHPVCVHGGVDLATGTACGTTACIADAVVGRAQPTPPDAPGPYYRAPARRKSGQRFL